MSKLVFLFFSFVLALSCSKKDDGSSLSKGQSIKVSIHSNLSGASLSGLNGNTYSITFGTSGASENNNESKVFVDTGAGWSEITGCTTLAISDTCVWTVPSINTATAKIKVEVKVSGQIYSPESGTFSIDSTTPSISAFQINGGATSTTDRNITLDLTAADTTNNISHYCVQLGSTSAPALGSNCWQQISESQNQNLSGLNFQLPLIPSEYKAYVFVKDLAGNISALSNGGQGTDTQDYDLIEFQLGNAPVVENLLVSLNANPDNPPTAAQKTFINSSPVYIKWSASDSEGLATTPISLYYTTDDVNYTEIATGLTNGSNGGCTINDTNSADDLATGCFIWNSGNTPSSYFKIRVKAEDNSGQVSFNSSDSMNVSKIKFVAGNTDPGLDGSASSAVFFPTDYSNATPDTGHMVVAGNGDFYFKDKRGLIKVAAADGLQKLYIPLDSNADLTAAAQSGAITSGTRLKNPQFITLDFDGNILIFDNDRIRKINLGVSPHTITTVIGGGASTTDGIDALDLQITPPVNYQFSYMPFTPLPNGDLLFQSDNYFGTPNTNYKIRYYTKSTGKITSFSPGGSGHHGDNTADLSNCNFKKVNITFDTTSSAITSANTIVYCSGVYYGVKLDPTTFQSVGNTDTHTNTVVNWNGVRAGLDGKAYVINKNQGILYRYNQATTNWDIIAGTYGVGKCADGQIATSCKIHPYDIFVDASSKVYFFDRGKIRYIDSQNKLQTLMGQGGDYGDGLKATNARFSKVYVFRHWNDAGTDKFVLLDHAESRLREFSYDGNINSIAGDGSADIPSTAQAASTEPIFVANAGTFWQGFVIDQSNGNIFMSRGNRHVGYLNRATDRWIDVIGGGANYYYNADGMQGNQITNEYGYPPIVMAQGDNKLVVAWSNYQAGIGLKNMHYKIYDQTNNYTQSHLAGNTGHSYNMCADGTALNACPMQRPVDGNSSMEYDALNSQWLYLDSYNPKLFGLKIGQTTSTFKSLSGLPIASTYVSGSDTTFYCNASDGKIYKKIGAAAGVALDWPIPSLKCEGRSLHYHSGKNSLFFIYKQNNLFGMAEYIAP